MTPYDAMLNNEVEAMQEPTHSQAWPIGTLVRHRFYGEGATDGEAMYLLGLMKPPHYHCTFPAKNIQGTFYAGDLQRIETTAPDTAQGE